MVMIVAHHFAVHGGFQFDSQTVTLPRLWWSFLEMGGKFGVDVFVLISGYFLIENNSLAFKPKKLLRLWGQIFFYSFLLFFVAFLIGKGDSSVKNIIKTLFPVLFNQWWFASTYFVMYLIHPCLNRFLRSLSQKEYQNLLLAMLFIWSVIPTFTTSAFQANSLIEFVLFYSIAGYIRLFDFRSAFSSRTWCLFWLGFSVLTYLSAVVFMLLGTRLEVFSDHASYFYKSISVLTVCGAVSFFMMFLKMNIKPSRFINGLSSATFGVYLIHDSNLLRPYLWQEVFQNASFQDSLLLIPFSLFAVITVFLSCSLIDLLRKKFIEEPFVRFVNAKEGQCLAFLQGIRDWTRRFLFGNEETK